MSQGEIPEEIRAIAALIGESSQIDSMMIDKPRTLITDTNTLKQGLNQMVQQSREQRRPQPSYPQPEPRPTFQQYETPPVSYLPSAPPLVVENDGQMELNLEPSKVDIIIDLLKDVTLKLKKQNNLLQDINEKLNTEKKRIPTSSSEPK